VQPNSDKTTRSIARTARKLPQTLLSRLHRLGVHNGGSAAVMAAILFPVVIGGLGLGAETGYWYLSQRKLQHAVDVSVHAAGARLRADDTDAKIQAAALHVATQSGYSPGTLTVDPHYTSDAHPGAKLVEVVATETRPRMFSAVVAGFFSSEPTTEVTLSARAVAMVDRSAGTVACVLALSPTLSAAAKVSGSTSIDLNGCDVASNSNAANSFLMDGTNAVLSTGCVYAVGQALTSNGLTLTRCANVKEYAPITRDPYADVAAPTSWSNCSGKNQGHPTLPSPNLTPRCFTGGLTVKGALHFEPGLYIIDGGEFNVNAGDNSKLTGSGVTFYLANGAKLNIGGSIQMNFSAPTSGTYSGILFFGSRTATGVSHVLSGNSASEYTGAIYAPASNISFAGSSKATGDGCTQIIGATVTLTGASTLKSTCDSAGTSDIATNEVVKIVE
jgi:Flp pilus assembly protein TadG